MQQKQVLTTEDIRGMSLKEFMELRQDRCNAIPATEFQEANIDWLLISDLEGIKNLKALMELTRQLKEDLWRDIQNRKKSGGIRK